MKRILLIEDDAQEREMFKIALEDSGYDVLEAPEGATGIQLFHQHGCDLVLTDVYMPGKEGLETIFELKEAFPEIKIIAMTGGTTWIHQSDAHDSDNVLQMAKTLGADRALAKPVRIPNLLVLLEELLEKEGGNDDID